MLKISVLRARRAHGGALRECSPELPKITIICELQIIVLDLLFQYNHVMDQQRNILLAKRCSPRIDHALLCHLV